uniref:Uncharacterized protein n=1 Tax=Triticum urartu TaxID=4572 RepID=A0A8R7TDT7_TRIUA
MSLCCTVKEKGCSHGIATVKKTACQQLNSTKIYLFASLMEGRTRKQKKSIGHCLARLVIFYSPILPKHFFKTFCIPSS